MPWLERNSAATAHVFVRTLPTGEAEERFLQQVPVVTGGRVVRLTTFAERDASVDSATWHVDSQLVRPVKLTALKRALNPAVAPEQVVAPAQ
jgi:hypothetical protein